MDQFAPYIGIAFMGLGVFGLAVGGWRIIRWSRRNGGRTGHTGVSDR